MTNPTLNRLIAEKLDPHPERSCETFCPGAFWSTSGLWTIRYKWTPAVFDIDSCGSAALKKAMVKIGFIYSINLGFDGSFRCLFHDKIFTKSGEASSTTEEEAVQLAAAKALGLEVDDGDV